MSKLTKPFWWLSPIALLALLIVGSCCAYVRMGTTLIGDFVSPDGALDAVLMVHNGAAA